MAIENKDVKRGRGRPGGREFTHIARIPMKPETWAELSARAEGIGISGAEHVRDLIERDLKRHR